LTAQLDKKLIKNNNTKRKIILRVTVVKCYIGENQAGNQTRRPNRVVGGGGWAAGGDEAGP